MHNDDLVGSNEVNIWYLSLHQPQYVLLATRYNSFVIFCNTNQELQDILLCFVILRLRSF